MEPGAVGTASLTHGERRAEDPTAVSGLVLLLALAAASFGQGAFSGGLRLFIAALLAVALVLVLVATRVHAADIRSGFVWAGALLAGWALIRAWAGGSPAAGLTWALFGAGTVAVALVSRRLSANSRAMLLGGLLTVGVAVALTGWLGIALHMRPWGLPSEGVWRAASTLTYANATAGLLVPLALVGLARLTAMPRAIPLSLAVMCLLTSTVATLSRAGIGALGVGLLVLCWLLGAKRVVRAGGVPALGAGVALAGLLASLRHGVPARPVYAALGMAAGLGLVFLAQRYASRKQTLVMAAAALSAALLFIVFVPQAHRAVRRLTQARLSLASSPRAGEAAAALRVIASHPLAGVGPGHVLRWTSPGGVANVDQYAHDEYLQVFTDLGVVGAVLAAVLLIAAGRLLWRARASSPDRALWAGAVAGAIAFALHSGFDFLWQVPAVPLTVAALGGIAIGLPPARQHRPPGDPPSASGEAELECNFARKSAQP
jgi:hypothetical protein